MVKIHNLALLAIVGHGATTVSACDGVISTSSGTCDFSQFQANLDPTCNITELFPAELFPDGAAAEVGYLCALDAPVQFVEIQGTYQRDRRYFAGGGPLVDGGDWLVDSARIKRFEKNVGEKAVISFPNYAARVNYNINAGLADPDAPNGYPANMNLYNSCELKTMMCCFTDDDTEATFSENNDATTDVCHHDLHDSPQSSHIKEGWSVFPDVDYGTHCVGFTWTDDTSLLGNMMYDVSLRNTANKGYTKGIPGGPMCGCVEHMPVVEHASCRTAAVVGQVDYSFVYDSATGKVSAYNEAEISYGPCADPDLKGQVIANDATKEAAISEHLVGKGNCASDSVEYLNDEQFLHEGQHLTKYVTPDPAKWSKLVVGEGIYFQPPPIDPAVADADFRALIGAGCKDLVDNPRPCMIRRICSSCTDLSHRDIFYRRYTDFPPFGFNVTAGEEYLLDAFMNNWVKEGNDMELGDFKLFSSYQDAIDETNAWTYCNYGPTGGDNYGFPRNCGPYGGAHQWNSYIRGGGYANHHGFYVELP